MEVTKSALNGIKQRKWVHEKYLFLSPDDSCEFRIHDAGIEFAAHERRPFVILDVPLVDGPWHLDVLAEALLLEIP